MIKAVAPRTALVYVGALAGAGFASGQELVRFFVPFGEWGALGAVLAGLGLGCGGLVIVRKASKAGATNYVELVASTPWPIGRLLSPVLDVFLFVGLVVMFSAAGSLATEQFYLPRAWGIALLAAATVACCWWRTQGFVRTSAALVLALLALLLLISLTSLAADQRSPLVVPPSSMLLGQHWWWSATLYVGYNLLIGTAVLPPLATMGSAVGSGALLGGLLLGGTAAVCTLALQAVGSGSDLPMLAAARVLGNSGRWIYGLNLALAMITTAAANLFGLAQAGKRYRVSLLVITTVALPPAFLPFPALVGYLYPGFGYAGLLLLVALLVPGSRR